MPGASAPMVRVRRRRPQTGGSLDTRSVSLRCLLLVVAVIAAFVYAGWGAGSSTLIWVLLGLLAFAAFFGGCALYNRPFPPVRFDAPGYALRSVQLDDFGTFWDVQQADSVLAEVESSWQATNTLVVVFIHGWHHNAAADDPNIADFSGVLRMLSEQLASPSRTTLRLQLTGHSDVRLMGLYVGWRGRSLPGVLDYANLWWRKLAAERVGDGDASEFLERLQLKYLRANSIKREPVQSSCKPFMGLVTMGHSLGGQVLLKSVARSLEVELTKRAPRLADVTGAPQPGPRSPERVPVGSLGDLNILLNPAAEAYQFGRIDALYRQIVYPPEQTPQLVVFSADDDQPRKAFFPIARVLTLPFRPAFRNAYQGELWGRALGELQAQRTHVLRRAEATTPDSLTDDDYRLDNGRRVKEHDFSDETAFGGVRLTRDPATPSGHNPIANSPIAVIKTTDGIIDGHNGIFRPEFQNFLGSYVAFIEGKRVLVRHDRFDRSIAQERGNDH